MSADQLTVSLNGVDNVGKTTQLAWLHRGMPGAQLVGTIDAWDSRWQQVAAVDFAHWWFVGSTTAEHTGLVLRSHVARRAGSERLALEDRGLPMLWATCAATAAVKEGLSPEEALRLVERLAAHLSVPEPRQEVHVLLRRFADPAREATEASNREQRPVDRRYVAYQRVLAQVIALQVDRGDYDLVLTVGDDPVLDVQRELRARLERFGISTLPLPDAALERVWVLAGLSESGKSTVGALLRDEHGVTRLKIGYLIDVAALRAGEADPYRSWSEPEQTERLTEEILRFAQANKARTISVESAHRSEATAHLKRVWGNRCHIVYVDAEDPVRAGRALETDASLRERDATKRGRGTHRIVDVADHVIDNSGPLSALKVAIGRLAIAGDLPRGASNPDAAPPVARLRWLDEATDHMVDEKVALVLATGSTGTSRWRQGWSDLDLLVVRDTAPQTWLRSMVGSLPVPQGVKVGISVFTTGDIDALRVPPRALRSLRHAAEGTGVLYQRPGYVMPVPTKRLVDYMSRGELGLVLMTTRRLVAQSDDGQIDVRAVHKHLVLLAKILLRADGHDQLDDPEEVLAAFCERHPAAGCSPPTLGALIRRPGDPALHQQLVEATDSLLTYFDQLDRIVRTKP